MTNPPDVEQSRRALKKTEQRLIDNVNQQLTNFGMAIIHSQLPPGYASKYRKAGYLVEYYADGGAVIKPRPTERCVIL